MLRTRALAVIAVLALCGIPTTAFAQSAGDDQYADPLAGQGGSSGSVNDGGSSGGGGGGSSGSSVTPSTPTTTAAGNTGTSGVSGSGQNTTAAGGAQGELPRTGFDVIVTIELGLAMLLAGLVAQRLLVLRDRRDS
jgi:hypothetical protein